MKTSLQPSPNPSAATASWPGSLALLTVPPLTLLVRDRTPAWIFMWTFAFAIFISLKWMTWWEARSQVPHSTTRSLAYLVAWPGMDAEVFLAFRCGADKPPYPEWLWALLKTMLGIALLWGAARTIPARLPLVQGWIGLLGLVLLLHFGSFHLIALFWQTFGIEAQAIMAKPLLSRTLSEFWGKRWNLGFRQLAHQLVFRPLHKRMGVAAASLLVFLASGLIHDLVISVPAHGGYGFPTAYFILQGLGITMERSSLGGKLGLQYGIPAWLFMFLMTAGPAFWLFHPPFVIRVILPFMHAVRAL